MHRCFNCTRVCSQLACLLPSEARRAWDLLDLELQIVGTHHLGVELGLQEQLLVLLTIEPSNRLLFKGVFSFAPLKKGIYSIFIPWFLFLFLLKQGLSSPGWPGIQDSPKMLGFQRYFEIMYLNLLNYNTQFHTILCSGFPFQVVEKYDKKRLQ